MSRFKSIILPILILYLIVTFTACSSESEPHIYIALGDSIASGYGLVSPTDRHTYIFYEMLRKEGYVYVEEKINKAIEEYTTTDLLELLNEMTDDQLQLFKNARIITLNIGGNNILVPFAKYLSNRADIEEMLAEEGETADIEESKSSLNGRIIDGTLAVWGHVSEWLGDAVSTGRTLLGLFSDELSAELEQGAQIFEKEFGEIIDWLKTNARGATIIVNTIYNPIPDKIWIIPVELSNKADEYIRAMNKIILEESETRGFHVADIHAAFSDRDDVMSLSQFNLNPFGGQFMSVDIIHPNRDGHTLIAELIYEQYQIAREDKKE